MTEEHVGRLVARTIKSLAVASGDQTAASAYAEGSRWNDGFVIAQALKSAVTANSTADLHGAMRPISADLAALVRPLSIVGRLQGLHRVPFQTRLVDQTAGARGAFVAEGGPTPVSSLSFSFEQQLDARKVGAIVVETLELARLSNPSSDAVIADDVGAAVAAALDFAFIDAANAGDAATPESITHNALSIPSGGSSLAQIDADLLLAVQALAAAGSSLATASWVVSERTAAFLATLRGSAGVRAFPELGARGGFVLGLPALVSAAVPIAGSPGTTTITLVDANGIALADDGGGELSVSGEAALQMSDAPSGSAAQLTSLWPLGLFATKATRFVNWARRRPGAVVCITGVSF